MLIAPEGITLISVDGDNPSVERFISWGELKSSQKGNEWWPDLKDESDLDSVVEDLLIIESVDDKKIAELLRVCYPASPNLRETHESCILTIYPNSRNVEIGTMRSIHCSA